VKVTVINVRFKLQTRPLAKRSKCSWVFNAQIRCLLDGAAVFSAEYRKSTTTKYADKEAVFERITNKLSLVELNTGVCDVIQNHFSGQKRIATVQILTRPLAKRSKCSWVFNAQILCLLDVATVILSKFPKSTTTKYGEKLAVFERIMPWTVFGKIKYRGMFLILLYLCCNCNCSVTVTVIIGWVVLSSKNVSLRTVIKIGQYISVVRFTIVNWLQYCYFVPQHTLNQ